MVYIRALSLSAVVLFLTSSFSGCDAGISDIPGLPECVEVDMTSSGEVCYPMTENVNQQQFICDPGTGNNVPGNPLCRQECSQNDPLTNTTISFYSDCTYADESSCTDQSLQLINPSCSLNGLQVGFIIAGCTLDSSSSLDGIFCNLTKCDLSQSLLDVFDKCSMCRWITVYADICTPTDSGDFFKCANVSQDQQPSSKFGCRAIACSTFGISGTMTLNTSTTSQCWEADWYDRLSR